MLLRRTTFTFLRPRFILGSFTKAPPSGRRPPPTITLRLQHGGRGPGNRCASRRRGKGGDEIYKHGGEKRGTALWESRAEGGSPTWKKVRGAALKERCRRLPCGREDGGGGGRTLDFCPLSVNTADQWGEWDLLHSGMSGMAIKRGREMCVC